MIENAFLDFGALGVMVAYLIYDRQVVIKELKKSIDKLTDAIGQFKTYDK